MSDASALRHPHKLCSLRQSQWCVPCLLDLHYYQDTYIAKYRFVPSVITHRLSCPAGTLLRRLRWLQLVRMPAPRQVALLVPLVRMQHQPHDRRLVLVALRVGLPLDRDRAAGARPLAAAATCSCCWCCWPWPSGQLPGGGALLDMTPSWSFVAVPRRCSGCVAPPQTKLIVMDPSLAQLASWCL